LLGASGMACGGPAVIEPAACGESPAFDTVTIPDGAARPELREERRETAFGSCLVRVSDHLAHAHSEVVHTGARHQAWNASASLVLLRSRQVMRSEDSSILRELPAASTPWVWHPSEANQLFALRGSTLVRYDLATDVEAPVLGFPQFGSLVTSFGLAEPAQTGAELAVVGMTESGGCEVLAVSPEQASAQSIVRCPEDALGRGRVPRYASITPKADGCVVEWGVAGHGRFEGIELYDLQGRFLSQLSATADAADVALDEASDQWLVYASYDRGLPGIFGAKLVLGVPAAVRLIEIEQHQSTRISCRALGTSSCIVSTHGSDPAGPHALDDEVFRVSLESRAEAPEVDRLAHHRSRPDFVSTGVMGCAVAEQAVLPEASPSRDGSRVVFGSSWGDHCYGELYWVNR